MKLPTEDFLCEFKCPFCGDRVEVTTEIDFDGWTKVHGYCDGQADRICGVGFEFGSFSKGVTLQVMKKSVMGMVGANQ